MYQRDKSSILGWVQVGDDIDGESAGDEFGRSLSLSRNGKVLASGAHFNDGNGSDSGHVRVFQALCAAVSIS